MDIKGYTLGQLRGHITNGSVKDFSYIPRLDEVGLYGHSIPKQGDCLRDWHQDPISSVDESITNRVAKSGMQHSISEWEQWISDHAAYLENQLLTDVASKESMNEKVLPWQFENILQREICDANASQQEPCFLDSSFPPICMTNQSPGFRDSSSQCPTFDCSTARIGCNTLRTDNACGLIDANASQQVPCFQTSSYAPISMTNPAGPSPSFQDSSSYWPTFDSSLTARNEPFNGGPTFPGSSFPYIPEESSQSYIQEQYHGRDMLSNYAGELNFSQHGGFMENNVSASYAGFPSPWEEQLELPYLNMQNSQKDPQWMPEASDVRNNLIYNPTRSTIDDLLQSQLLMPRCQEFHQWQHQPHLQPYLIEDLRCHNETVWQEASKRLKRHSEQSHGVSGKLYQGYRKPTNGLKRAFSNRDLSGISSVTKEDVMPKKCRKTENSDSVGSGVSLAVDPAINQPYAPEQLSRSMQQHLTPEGDSSVAVEVDTGLLTPIQCPKRFGVTWNDGSDTAQRLDFKSTPIPAEDSVACCRHKETERTCIKETRDAVIENCLSEEPLHSGKEEEIQVRTMSDQAKPETKGDLIASAANNECAMKSEEPNIPVVSFTDLFTAEQIKEHISSLRQQNNQSIRKEASENTIVNESPCQLCAMGKLVFAVAPKYCSVCDARIKPSLIYYCGPDEMGTKHCICPSCFKESRGGSISFQGVSISKANLCKTCNNEEHEESWVQCNKCEQWQHQICGLYNKKQDLEGTAEYICPKCHLEEIETGKRIPLSKTAAFGAKNLQSTRLSDHIEGRLHRRLKQEREERAKSLGKNVDEVPEATDLVVRVVLSVKKQLKVKQQFLDIFQDENYPTGFPYRSKVILLFQKIQGVDVCLFGMYVQEFGSECSPPNQRCVYISFLDSVKYFIPEVETASGEALRTFVYHEILIGYLEYCKKRGFATCYLWACPPVKGQDYILYCHPEMQRTPKADKLRRWYKSMLKKAAKENIAVDITNLYDQLFISTGGSRTKITAARLPYFDGDYWSTAAENVMKNIEEESGGDLQRKVKKLTTKRNLKAMGHANPSGGAVKDILLMHKLGQTMLPLKEDFLMIYLQHTCTCCHEVILTGSRWICNQCKKFQLCERCHDVKDNVNEDGTHTSQSGERHPLSQVAVDDVPADTEDHDSSLDNDFFEFRHTFLNFCLENHYQFDTLRHAKHSSLMILHHLWNLTAPSSGTNCSICHKDVMVNQSWHCDICPEFDVCTACYQTKSGACHIHELTRLSSTANCESNIKQPQGGRPKLSDLAEDVPHAFQCLATESNPCSYRTCLVIKKYFLHSRQCSLWHTVQCEPCQLAKRILWGHSRKCRDSDCRIPQCKNLKRIAENISLQPKPR